MPAHITHGMTKSPEFVIWIAMKSRCFRPSHPKFHQYGGAGITVCPEWLHSFEAFYEHIGPRPSPLHTVDRIDGKLSYQPGNVRWATWREQIANRSNTIWLEHGGERLVLMDWSRRLGIGYSTLKERIRRGWSVADVLTKPVGPSGPKPKTEGPTP